MIRQYLEDDYQSVTRSRSPRVNQGAALKSPPFRAIPQDLAIPQPITKNERLIEGPPFLKRGHVFSFGALFLFTVVLYARPAEFYPSSITNSLALIVGIVTLATFAATQITLEGRLTARPAEVNLVLLFMLTAALSIPLAIDPLIAWQEFSATFIRAILVFIVIVNVVRTEARLKVLLSVSIITAVLLSIGAMNEYRLGLMTIEGYRAGGRGTGLFGNTNDMALHLVTILPLSVAFFFGSRGPLRKTIHAICAALMIFAIVLSYSRGAFLGVLVTFAFFAFRIGRRSKIEIAAVVLIAAIGMILVAPSGYGNRLLSIFIPELDPNGSADSRRGELFRSVYVALRHPLLGIGMGNYQPNMSYRGLVTHNSYTQVASEMGLIALTLYTMFIVKPLRKLSAIARQTFGVKEDSHFYYLALGLQASLLVYMVSSFFLSVPYVWNVYYLVGYAVCFRRIYESETGKIVTIEKRRKKNAEPASVASAEQAVIA
ncbi:MAG TPA: O-antigen ligase family protein [Pyrinomonadaceae bacterium]|nr:O-antigen ligase family protein [Pyrinomonadaceae bacterium]